MEYLCSGRPFAVLDLGTAYVKALLVHRGPTGHWSVVGVGSASYPREGSAEGDFSEAHAEAATEALRRAMQRSLQLAGRELAPACCLISIPTPPALLTIETNQVSRPQPSVAISAEEARSRVEAAEWAATESARHESERLWPETKPLWLGVPCRSASVDGHPVTTLEGFCGTSIRLQTGVASVGSSAAKWRGWSQSVGARPILVPEPLWASQVLLRSPRSLLLDIGGHCTRVHSLRPDGGLCQASLPVGGYHFTRYLSLAAGVSPSRAERLKIAYAAGRLKPRSEQRVRQVMRRALGTWARRLVKALSRLEQPLPRQWLLTGGGSPLPELALLPTLLADDSILGLLTYPVLQPLVADDACRLLVPGPERLSPAHTVALTLADWWVRLGYDPVAREHVTRAARLAGKAGFEVDADWLRL